MKRRRFLKSLEAGLVLVNPLMINAFASELERKIPVASEELPSNPEVMGYSTIQEAIYAAEDYSIVLVPDGIYTGSGNRDLDFKGKPITAKSENGPEYSIIDGEGLSNTRGFVFISGETHETAVDGITVMNIANDVGTVCVNNSSPIIKNCVFTQGWVNSGGAFYINGSSPTLVNNIIMDIHAQFYGGGIDILGGNSVNLTNNIIIYNTASNPNWGKGGGGICIEGGSAILQNNVIYGNESAGTEQNPYGGGISCLSSNIEIINSILWENKYTYWVKTGPVGQGEYRTGNTQLRLSNSSVKISYSNIQGGLADITKDEASTIEWSEGNIDVDPIFINSENRDFHLQEGSPCKGSGKDGLDMGAYPGKIVRIRNEKPIEFSLSQNYPNPFNPSTTIKYQLPEKSNVRLDIYNTTGKKVRMLVDTIQESGQYEVRFDAGNLSSGIYFYILRTQYGSQVQKMLFLK